MPPTPTPIPGRTHRRRLESWWIGFPRQFRDRSCILYNHGEKPMLSCIFFDAGNTLVFPDLSKTLAPLMAAGYAATQEQLYAAERFAKKRLDLAMHQREPGQSVDHDYSRVYYTQLIL